MELAAQESPSPYAQGKMRLNILGGAGDFGGSRYVILGGGFGYFVVEGLELGADFQQWFGSPNISKIGPQARYILPLESPFAPFIGAMYRHAFIAGEDIDTVGARGGVVYRSGSGILGLGVLVERILNCGDRFRNCRAILPEISFAFIF